MTELVNVNLKCPVCQSVKEVRTSVIRIIISNNKNEYRRKLYCKECKQQRIFVKVK